MFSPFSRMIMSAVGVTFALLTLAMCDGWMPIAMGLCVLINTLLLCANFNEHINEQTRHDD